MSLLQTLEPAFREVVRQALFDVNGRFTKFAMAPSSAAGHHSMPGGNLLHTLDVADCALQIAARYEGLVDNQVLLTAALLHDIGKAEEYQKLPHAVTLSEWGAMLGHKLLGCAMVWTALEPLRAQSEERALAVMNAIGSSAGRSFDMRGPATLEAIILSKADQISAAADLYRQSLQSCRAFQGLRHRHLAEAPRHPCALPRLPDASAPKPPIQSSRAKWYSARRGA